MMGIGPPGGLVSRWRAFRLAALAASAAISILIAMRSLTADSVFPNLALPGPTTTGNHKVKRYLTDAQLLLEAYNAGEARPAAAAGPPRIAFLFLVRGNIPHEPLWRRFFEGHEAKYSLYVHASPGHVYPAGSLFEGKEVPSKPCLRFSRGIVDALRRLLAHALLDTQYDNAWFVNACEATVPVRGFAFVYDSLTRSRVSFVESFRPGAVYQSWATAPEFSPSELRKGELWMALARRHALTVVGDTRIYFKFTAGCTWWCTWDEEYVQTLLALTDAGGIANRTVFYVNWTAPHTDSPFTYDHTTASLAVIQDVQRRTWDTDGERHDTALDNTTFPCIHNTVVGAPCFLFARKFHSDATKVLLALSPRDLGY